MTLDRVIDGHILNIVQNKEVQEQSDLQRLLKERGFDIPQATLSRRLKKLNIAKISGLYQILDYNQPNLPIVLNIQISEFGIIVLHTHPGNANSLAYYLDQKYVTYTPHQPKYSGVLGTIAGDDTVILIVKSKEALTQVLRTMKEEFPYLGLD
jgi:transcriptional regulator of arginine metabolism